MQGARVKVVFLLLCAAFIASLMFTTRDVYAATINVPGDYATIQLAINNANAGDTIIVAAGTYNERLTISKSIDLRGAQYGVDPTQAGARTNSAAESIIDLTGLPLANPNVLVEISSGVSTVSVAGFTLIGSPTFHYADEAIVRCWSNDIHIEDNIMNGFYGVLYKGPGSGLTVNRNRMTVNKAGVTLQPGASNSVTISGNVISMGSSPDADASGIYMTACSQSSITGNTITGFTSRGVGGSNNDHLTISGNTLTGNKDAFSMWGTTTFITIDNNVLSNSLRYGINIKGQDITIINNDITGNGDTGVYIDRHVIDTLNIEIHYNNIYGNTNYGVYVNVALVTVPVHAENNWWGDASGPLHTTSWLYLGNPYGPNPGSGDRVSDLVLYDPWLSEQWPPPPPRPVGGEWIPIDTLQMLVQIVASALATSAIAASFIGIKRIKRKD